MTKYNLGPVMPHVRKAAEDMGPRFGIKVIGGYRPTNDGGYHYLGRALDFMCTRAQGDQLAAYAWANRGPLGVTEVIWRQRIITTARASEGWRTMPNRGSATQNHMDHVHLSFNASGGDGGSWKNAGIGYVLGGVPGAIIGGTVGNPIEKVGGVVTDAAGGVVGGLDAIGGFFGAISQRGTWVRVLQVVGGAGLVVTGVVIVGKGTIVNTALNAVPGGAVIKAAGGAAAGGK